MKYPNKIKQLFPRLSVVKVHETRLEGGLLFGSEPELGAVYVKWGLSHQLEELRREAQLLSDIGNQVPCAEILFQHFENEFGLVITQAIDAIPLHEANLKSEEIIQVLYDVLQILWQLPQESIEGLTNGVLKEVDEIELMMNEDRIDLAGFHKATGLDPKQHLTEARQQFELHPHDIVAHGDFCLPNVLFGDTGVYLVDWGKSGRGHRARDMASIRTSLARNNDPCAFQALADALGFDLEEHAQHLDLYRSLDFYWYNQL